MSEVNANAGNGPLGDLAVHERYMRLALENARAAQGQTAPNPLVGSVIVGDGRLVGIGAHLKPGEPHAEIHALRMAGEHARGATIYVTLEPCSHHGRTGPCAEAIVQAGLARVVVAAPDPNPLVAGRGIKILRDAGIEVIEGVLREESEQLNEVFNRYIVSKRPFVTVKSAVTLDGKIATRTASSRWITSEQAREDVHRLRHESGAILVGVQTILHDDSQLTTRLPSGRNPLRVVLDSTLRIPETARVITDGEAPTWIFTGSNADAAKRERLEAAGVRVFETRSERVNLEQVLDTLGASEISSLLVEGGGQVNASFVEQGLADKLVLYVAPKLVGGKEAPTFLQGLGIADMDDAVDLTGLRVRQLGPDLKLEAYFPKS
ncbi:bifunctional diaminohydroxyphosphoribosylaminopyrimidine deaminase/5-amino-6-(5-phosphoribosylamino)uracil reductase RibD [Saccharibacillus sp. CPCC 101409]|uniref:bifunctional diaminohydroxyphosphoribosylaminopyrimidine deaminase/5-amino-6-(5-phosphoribosylamino)uracil reductase RibD n=1 Tax=Saccharibacillus sp. CPCC 101409 TaxID=3058041 RepID=UPI0026725C50|nr:bifunctional diaminohydroxyphosphoribosylaminopyrimidine deaminase/5-amino-6-(5-phosphoribosylamino)uracil reductase RibD [Saccharibacillus sp. CPCC 101409]MDO3411565.1 bifunctional diaminohydroxyphosphoribosylaminopyrimidine deaminase/5-amino-6-(5-phosphoribosylamino)uracil reductase RibD [Saccharibacillus sp. CPCC 101409]